MKQQKQRQPNLYLVGFMGVGKSAIGRRVASELGYRFLDSDYCIEQQVGKKIPAIFAESGEAHFRLLEREFIESGHPGDGCVVSCGGGLVVQPGMSDRLKEKGVVICLFASLDSIIERTSRNKNRPLLNVADPAAQVRSLLKEREPIYMQAGACITTDGRSIPEVVRHLLRTYKSCKRDYLKSHPGQ
ncbi:MAG: shikimate kinase [Puniceicoccaceae bacterium]|nr:MAG: shikimate kinase [Puniceicoccaceae bacterium]